MILDQQFNFASGQAIGPANTDVLSTNVYDAGSAIKLFAGSGKRAARIVGYVTAIGGTTPNVRARLVGATNAALTGTPVILADTGVSRTLVAADLPWAFELIPVDQQDAKQFYGVIFTQGGNADNTATVVAQGALEGSNNLIK